MTRYEDLFTKYDLPPRGCNHTACDGDICIVNPVRFRDVLEWKYISQLSVPMLGGFRREIKSRMVGRKKHETVVYYKKMPMLPKAVKLTNYDEVLDFLKAADISIPVECFEFNSKIDVKTTLDRKRWWDKCLDEDVSRGLEVLQIPVVNLVDKELPVIDEYLMNSVFLNEERHPKRLNVCCDCTDDCRDKTKCACFLQTLKTYNPDERKLFKNDEEIGYDFRKLVFKRQNLSGIYECNSRCRCNSNALACLNRVVQFPARWKLQLCRDKDIASKGWGVRTLNDIPAGSFVGSYSGQMGLESEANERCASQEWKDNGGWKYIVNLQVIQSAAKNSVTVRPRSEKEKGKKPKPKLVFNFKTPEFGSYARKPTIRFGFLDCSAVFDVPEIHHRGPNHPTLAILESQKEIATAQSLTDMKLLKKVINEKMEIEIRMKLDDADHSNEADYVSFKGDDCTYRIPWKEVSSRKAKIGSSSKFRKLTKTEIVKTEKDEEECNVKVPARYNPKVALTDLAEEIDKYKPQEVGKRRTYVRKKKQEVNDENVPLVNGNAKVEERLLNLKKDEEADQAHAQSPLLTLSTTISRLKRPRMDSEEPVPGPSSTVASTATATSTNAEESPSPSKIPKLSNSPTKSLNLAKKGYTLRRSAMGKNYSFKKFDAMLKEYLPSKKSSCQPKTKVAKENYLVDGRVKGNVGRYFNHSCDPNLFCQYVFIDNQDIRFPIVAFFAKRDIKAGEELTWSYNYDDDCEMGINPIPCKCGASNCRGILMC